MLNLTPEIAFIAIGETHFDDDANWRRTIDVLARHGMYDLVTVTMRVKGHSIVDPETKALFQRLVDYAGEQGLGIALDLDPRLARAEFLRRYPEDLQRIVYLHHVSARDAAAGFNIEAETFHDHMTGDGTPYLSIRGTFVRALACRLSCLGAVIPETVEDISNCVEADASDTVVRGRVTGMDCRDIDRVMILVEFSLFSPDVFSPRLVPYQRELIELYADLPLQGVIKDEWGFPPTRAALTEHRAFWYSAGYDDAYRETSGGRSLLNDLPLMSVPFKGCEEERRHAINVYMGLNHRRNTEIEQCYYADVKEVFGPDAFVGKHATWYPRINKMEIFKNGLSWWGATRDIGQTDEITPLSACTALAKKFGSPCWLNEGYAPQPESYRLNIWRYAAAGGRMVFHPLHGRIQWPEDMAAEKRSLLAHGLLLTEDLIRAECRVRLLNYISNAPLDCPVAFVFGHEQVMNWAGDGYLDYGEDLSLDLWRNGYGVDLYPSTEIGAGTFKLGDDGYVMVGAQRYSALVLHQPNMCPSSVAEFFCSKPATRTALYRIGDWRCDSKSQPFDGAAALPCSFRELAKEDALQVLLADLEKTGVARQTPLVESHDLWSSDQIAMPSPNGISLLTDGTVIRLAAMHESDAGDPISGTVNVAGVPVDVQAIGLFAARMDANLQAEAMAAGGLTYVNAPGLILRLDAPLDVALWRDEGGWHGVAQGIAEADLSECLKQLTADWQFLSLREPFIPRENESIPRELQRGI